MAVKKIKKHYVVVGTGMYGDVTEVDDYNCEVYTDLETAKRACAENGDGWLVAEIVVVAKAPPKPNVEFVPYA